jgi:hypothetical protein
MALGPTQIPFISKVNRPGRKTGHLYTLYIIYTQPCEYKYSLAIWKKSSGSGLETENTAVGIRHADHMALSIRKRWH